LTSFLSIPHTPILKGTANLLPSSKSISNRVLILNTISGNLSVVSNLSSARDTQLMQSLVNSPDKLIDVQDAGTTMRFLTAYFALAGKNKILTGTERMKQRPIALLVNALRQIGVTISYLENEGFPPLETKGFGGQKANSITIPGDVSSQFISALMMTAPLLPHGLTINLGGKVGSRPYIEMTAALMKEFGVKLDYSANAIYVPPGNYRATSIRVEADWSAASYWFAFTALAAESEITLPNVSKRSLQGDSIVVEIMEKLGVLALFHADKVSLRKQAAISSLEWDFTNCPDLAQTILPVCAAKGVTGSFTGMESLRIKETDRIAALQSELVKIGALLSEEEPGHWKLTPGTLRKAITIQTYHDHRMAMGFAPLATLVDLTIEDPGVVDKSYPGFWEDMKSVGFVVR
jgi:3-phosphoshikimate 1-carboxyvinyltransferase